MFHFAWRATLAVVLVVAAFDAAAAQSLPPCPGRWVEYRGSFACRCPNGAFASGYPRPVCPRGVRRGGNPFNDFFARNTTMVPYPERQQEIVISTGTGGAYAGTGGAHAGTGGAYSGTGGAYAGTGGAHAGTGGAFSGTGGAYAGTGGAYSRSSAQGAVPDNIRSGTGAARAGYPAGLSTGTGGARSSQPAHGGVPDNVRSSAGGSVVEVPDDVKASEGARSQAAKHTAAASKGDAGVTTGAVPARIAAPAAEKLGTSPGDTAKSTSNAYGWSSQMPSSSGRSSPSTHWVSLQPADEKGLSLEVSGSTPTGCSDCGSETGVKFVADVAVETALGVGMGGHAGKTLQGLSYIGAGVGIAKDWDSLKQKTPEELASYVAPDVLAHGITYIPGAAGVASGLGPQIAITGTLVGSYRFGEAYVAPAVSPWISDKLVDQFPGMFIPPSNTSS